MASIYLGKDKSMSQVRKQLTREIAKSAGEKLIRAGGDEPENVKISIKPKKKAKSFKKQKTTAAKKKSTKSSSKKLPPFLR